MPKTARPLIITLLAATAALGTLTTTPTAPHPRTRATISADATTTPQPGDMTWG